MNYKTLQTNFQRELLLHIIFNLRHKKITEEKAKQTAQEVLKVMDKKTETEFLDVLAKLSRQSREVRDAFLTIATEYEREYVEEHLKKVREEIN